MSHIDAPVWQRAVNGSSDRLRDGLEETRSNIYARLERP